MRFSHFIFTESRNPARDGAVIDEVLDAVRLSDALGHLFMNEVAPRAAFKAAA